MPRQTNANDYNDHDTVQAVVKTVIQPFVPETLLTN